MWRKLYFRFVLFLRTAGLISAGLITTVFTTVAWANTYSYQADVNGMVCAFCAYSVSKNVSTLQGVEADSVTVDLYAGRVSFYSNKIVNEDKLISVFADSGFTISNLQVSEIEKSNINLSATEPVLVLTFDSTKTELYKSIIEAIGDVVASTSSQLLIMAPQVDEDTLLKPLLMGRQQVIRVRFVADESEKIRIQLFAEQ
ncbi:MAG: heavy-metal-associated domain-containing protein [Gammaproteobacteria bacterium]|nr:heavy-metal-associated domain-containing protein [Gammaproteobacteria bacterium]